MWKNYELDLRDGQVRLSELHRNQSIQQVAITVIKGCEL